MFQRRQRLTRPGSYPQQAPGLEGRQNGAQLVARPAEWNKYLVLWESRGIRNSFQVYRGVVCKFTKGGDIWPGPPSVGRRGWGTSTIKGCDFLTREGQDQICCFREEIPRTIWRIGGGADLKAGADLKGRTAVKGVWLRDSVSLDGDREAKERMNSKWVSDIVKVKSAGYGGVGGIEHETKVSSLDD